MRDLHALIEAVQHNCHITDARHARSMTMCAYLLEMQQYYRWENGIPYSASLPKGEVGNWLVEREKLWSEFEDLPYSPLRIDGEIDPFDSMAVNRLIVPEGYVYGAGYGRFGKPHFFLGRLSRKEVRGDYTILVSDCEYARDLVAPTAAFQNGTIFLRRDAVRRMVWEGLWKKRGDAAYCHDASTPDAALEVATERECEAVILHELGEGMAGEMLGRGWEAMVSDAASIKTEVIVRAVRDLLADCLSTLPGLIKRGEECSLHFYFENLSGMRRELFPLAIEAYRAWCAAGDPGPLSEAIENGSEHWLDVGRNLLGKYQVDGKLLLENPEEFRL